MPRFTSFRTYVFCPQTQHITPRALIRTCDAEDVFWLLNSQEQELTLVEDVEIRKQNAPEEAQKPQH
jgi:hypothetical protein